MRQWVRDRVEDVVTVFVIFVVFPLLMGVLKKAEALFNSGFSERLEKVREAAERAQLPISQQVQHNED